MNNFIVTWALGNISGLFPLDFDYLETKNPAKRPGYTLDNPIGISLYMTLNWLSERKWKKWWMETK